MEKPGRNDPCHCGSGKKYKKCCLQRDEATDKAFSDMMGPSDFKPAMPKDSSKDLSWLKDYDQLELLKMLAYLQVLPQNHGKNLRIEVLITEVINKGTRRHGSVDLQALCTKLQQYLTKHAFEDPPEEFATENISFYEQNFVVYPGIFNNGVDIVQGHLFALSGYAEELPREFVWSVSAGVMFILTVHDRIARRLGQTHRMYKETETHDIYIPEISQVQQEYGSFYFTKSEIEEICNDLQIDPNMIDRFTYTHRQTIRFDDMDSNPLFTRPFVRFDEGYLLVMPVCEIGCLNDFMISEAKAYRVLPEFMDANAREAEADLRLLLRGMGWTELNNDFSPVTITDPGITLNQQLYQFDQNKLAYVITFNEIPVAHLKKAKDFEQRSKDIERTIKASLAQIRAKVPQMQILLVTVINESDTFAPFYLNTERYVQADQHFSTTLPELTVMTAKWQLDHLSLWKFVKALRRCEKDIAFGPYSSNLAKYDWFDKNHGSFYQSDEAQANFLIFDFSIDGSIKREAKTKMDRITIPFFAHGRAIHIRCRRKEQYYPVYFSDEVKMGLFRYALLKYNCPLWIQSNTRRNRVADIYQNALFYWFHEGFFYFNALINRFGSDPVTISLVMDSKFEDTSNWDTPMTEGGPQFSYKLLPEHRAVEMTVPVDVVAYLRGADNQGEAMLIGAVLRGFNQLLGVLGKSVCTEDEMESMLQNAMPPSRKKMIVISEATEDPALAPVGTAEPRSIQETDISAILHNQLDRLPGKPVIPEKILNTADKIKLLNDLVGLHFNTLIEQIRQFDCLQLLSYLMNRNEALIHERSVREINIPVEEACYGQFYDVFERFKKTEGNLVSASLAIRSLIEFVACESPAGNKPVNDDDIDELMAYMNELISYGSMSDLIMYGINNPDMGLLPSGRLGIDHEFETVTIEGFRTDVYKDDFARFGRTFDRNFSGSVKEKKELTAETNRYWDRVDNVFLKEWGATLWDLSGACEFMANSMVADGVNVALWTFEEIADLLARGNTGSETQKFVELLSYTRRQGVLNVTKKERHETYPWRFNRRLAYIVKPIMPVEKDGVTKYLISARHLHMASQNLVARFFNGTLKVKPTEFGIQNLLAERNDIKGKQFRDNVAGWLKTNTNLQVVDHEAKIKPKGYFDADTDKGDIDILEIDHENRVIHAIECKNTTQAKIAYDIYSEIANYLGTDEKEGMIIKHVRRDAWLKNNADQVHAKLKLDRPYKINSFVLTKNILPTKYIRKTELPLFAFSELIEGKTEIVITKPKI